MTLKRLFDTSRYCREDEKQGEIPGFFRISKDLLKLIWASMIETLLIASVTIFDSIQVSTYNNLASSAIDVTKQPYFVLVALVASLNICLSAIVARRKGQKDVENANKTLHLGVIMSGSFSITLSIILIILARPICLLMKATDNTIDMAVLYFRILCGGFIFNGLAMTFNACQKGVGNTSISMISNIASNIVNIFLNYCLINGKLGFPELGIKGAAIATITGQFMAFTISLIAVCLQKDYVKFSIKRLFKFDKNTLKPILQLLPSIVIEQLLMRVGFILFSIIVNSLGDTDTYIQGRVMDINHIFFALADGFAIGTAAIVGHKLGEQRKDLAIIYAKVAMILSFSFGIVFFTAVFFLRDYIILLFKPDSDYKFKTISNALILAIVGAAFQNIQWVNTAILRTAGDTKFTARTSLISVALVRPITASLLVLVLFSHTNENGEIIRGLGVYGAWISQLIDQILRMSLNLSRFVSRKWTNIKV